MKLCLVLLLASAVVATYASALDREIEHHWSKYKAHHPKSHHKHDEHARKANFHKTHKKIEAHNSANNHYEMGHNHLSDLHDHEKQAMLGLRVPANVRSVEWTVGVEDRALPASIDYRTDRCLQPIKNQGSCGSCWSFSAIASLEFSKCKQTRVPVALSEQQLVDCDRIDGGCNGGWPSDAWKWLQQNGGSNKQSTYAYTGAESTCKFNAANVGSKVAIYSDIAQNPTAIMAALEKYGPLAIAITVVDNLYNYRTGIYSDPTCTRQQVNHAVNLVGYGTLSGQDYWVVRNSWGTGWGNGGYALFKRGVNMCNIESFASAVVAA